MPTEAISLELQRIQQFLSVPKDFRDHGPPDFRLRPHLFDLVNRYSRGQCLTFAARLASELGLQPAALFCGGRLSHAFLVQSQHIRCDRVSRDAVCIDIGGVWTLAEMRTLQRYSDPGTKTLLVVDVPSVLAQIDASNADADDSLGDEDNIEVLLQIAGCLPHLIPYVPAKYHAVCEAEALERLDALRESGWILAAPQRLDI